MWAKIKKANHVFMMEAAREVSFEEVQPFMLNRGFFSCPSCKETVYFNRNGFASSNHSSDCEYVTEKMSKK